MVRKFKKCFPSKDGISMICQYYTGEWVKFPIKKPYFKK